MIIGICGKSGSGKTTLAKRILENKNGIHLDIDKIGHYVLTIEEVKKELVNSFGSSILNENSIDRKRLGDIVFSSKLEMNKLKDITWKYMQIEIDKFIEENKDKIIILDWILLPTSKYFNMCDIKVLLNIPYEIRKDRALKRDDITEEKFNLRDEASIDYDRDKFDFILEENNEKEIKRLVKLI